MLRHHASAWVAAGLMMFAVGAIPSAAQTSRPRTPPAVAQCDAGRFHVVIDVGHTPEVPGAISARGETEFDYNLKLAKAIERKLTEAGFERTTLMIGSGEAIPSLVKRTTQINASAADLVLSVHHDSVPQIFKVKWNPDGKPQEYSDRFRGHSIFVSAENVAYRNSLAFGKLLGARLKARGMAYTPHYTEAFMGSRQRQLVDAETGVYRYDQLLILKNTRAPAVLLEAGSIVHREEELLMRSPEQRQLIAGAVTEAIEAFCAQKGTRTARASAVR
jgi:N-acetylmuramoyl-L-alanine amidase